MLVRVIYLLQNLLWMRGILRMEITENRKRYAGAAVTFGAFVVWEQTVGFGGNAPVIWIGMECGLILLLFCGKVREIVIKYFFSLFYMGIISEPLKTALDIGDRCFAWKLTGERRDLLVDLLVVLILAGLSWALRDHRRWELWIKGIPLKYFSIGLLAGVCASGVSSFSYSMMEGMPRRAFIFYRIISMALEEFVYLAGIFVAFLAELNGRYQRESVLKGNLLAESRKHFEALEQQMKETRRIRHDMKHHLETAEELMIKDGYTGEGLQYLEQVIGRTKRRNSGGPDVGNSMVNATIEAQMARMLRDIRLECAGGLRGDLQADSYDLCVMFNNLLSNAIEACEKLKRQEKRISLRLRQAPGAQIIEVENPIEWQVDVEKLGHYTSKQDKTAHGLGLLNVMEAVERSKGKIEFKADGGSFQVRIQLKCGKKSFHSR